MASWLVSHGARPPPPRDRLGSACSPYRDTWTDLRALTSLRREDDFWNRPGLGG